jgi:hypothetical protein
VGAVHAWVGPRYVLPQLFRLPGFQEMLPVTPRVRRLFLVAWQLASAGIMAFATLIPVAHVLERPDRIQLFVLTITVMMTPSPLILGTYLSLLLRSKTSPLGTWFTVLLWALLAVVIVAAWRAADREASPRGMRPNNALKLTRHCYDLDRLRSLAA